MGSWLSKLGGFAYRRRWIVFIFWAVILIGLGITAKVYMKSPTSEIVIPGTEAQQTFDRYGELFPSTGLATGKIVFATNSDKKIADYKQQINDLLAKVAKVDTVTAVVSPFDNPNGVSDSGTIAYAVVQIDGESGSVDKAITDAVASLVDAANVNGLEVERGGDLIRKTPDEIIGVGEIAGVLIALLVLVITFGAMVAAGLPIVTALLTVGVSMAGLFSLSQLIDINSTTPALAVMLGLAVGIDYSLFIVNRYRMLLAEGYQYLEAAKKAVATAGNAVIFAAGTVIIALSALAVVQIPFMTTMGLAAAGAVLAAALLAITVVPAMLGSVGPRIFSKKRRAEVVAAQKRGVKHTEHASHEALWYKLGRGLTRRRWLVVCASVVVLGAVALPIRDMQTGLPTDEFSAKNSTQRKAYDLISKGFGAGYNGTLLLVVEGMPNTTNADREAVRSALMAEYDKQVADATAEQQASLAAEQAKITTQAEKLAFEQKVANLQTEAAAQKKAALAKIDAEVDRYAPLYQYNLIAKRIAALDDVQMATPSATTDNGSVGVIQVVPKSGASDQATKDLIAYLRNSTNESDILSQNGASYGVTGTTAMVLDINKKLSDALPVYLLVVVGLSLILLVIAFHSILVPIKATLGFLLSVGVMFGALVMVFQWGWFGIAEAPGPIVSMIPIIAIGILFGLSMDYEFFLVSGMHEAHEHTRDAQKAVLRGYTNGARVVLAAGAIMVSVFAGFITNADTTIQAIGFALTVGIFADAFIVRLLLVPAVMSLLGKAAWWMPKWLGKMLPHVSIEGED